MTDKRIDGFLLDKFAFMDFFANRDKRRNDNEDDPLQKCYDRFQKFKRTTKLNKGDKLSYGILVRDIREYKYYHDVIVDNGIVKETMIALDWNEYAQEHTHQWNQIGSTLEPLFWESLKLGGMTIAGICLFGMVYEFSRRRGKLKNIFSNKVSTKSNALLIVLSH